MKQITFYDRHGQHVIEKLINLPDDMSIHIDIDSSYIMTINTHNGEIKYPLECVDAITITNQ